MKNGTAILVACILIAGLILITPAEQKEIKKTAGETVIFRTYHDYYRYTDSIAFNENCDGSDLDIYGIAGIAQYYGVGTCDDKYGTPLITDLPGNDIYNTVSCTSQINLYYWSDQVRYVVCCNTNAVDIAQAHFSTFSIGTETSVSNPDLPEKFCGAAPSCSCTAWSDVSCGYGTCASDQMRQDRTCTPADCDIEAQCVTDVTCQSGGNLDCDGCVEDIEFPTIVNNWKTQEGCT